jgi:methionyl aminopeptidase
MGDLIDLPGAHIVIGRNDPCWCGSGQKYKKCHMQQDAVSGKIPGETKQLKKMVKTPVEIDGMRKAGAFNGELLDYIRPFVKAGVSTAYLDKLVHEYTVGHGNTPACLGYHNFPRSVCTSINNVVCHGIPSEKEILKDGDIINIDCTTIVNGFYGDSSETFMIGAVSEEARRLVHTTALAMVRGIASVKPGRPMGDIARAIEPFVEKRGCSVVRQYTGHGIGKAFHENFTVYHNADPDSDRIIMKPGMTFTIEPMINLGDFRVVTDPVDKWTARTADGSLSAQFEHTVLVTENNAEILTLTPSQKASGVIVHVEGLKKNELRL